MVTPTKGDNSTQIGTLNPIRMHSNVCNICIHRVNYIGTREHEGQSNFQVIIGTTCIICYKSYGTVRLCVGVFLSMCVCFISEPIISGRMSWLINKYIDWAEGSTAALATVVVVVVELLMHPYSRLVLIKQSTNKANRSNIH